MRPSITSFIVSLCFGGAVLAAEPRHSYKPAEGFVPNAETAVRIAIAVWEPIYGRDNIEGQKPIRAELKDGIWYVSGTLPAGLRGGVAEAEIAKLDGRILRVSHGK